MSPAARDDIIAYGGLTPHHCRQDPQEIVNAIRELGAKNCIMVTDGGDVGTQIMSDAPGLLHLLLHYGISKEDLTIMLKRSRRSCLTLNDANMISK